MSKYILRDGTTFEVISIEDAKIELGLGEDGNKESLTDKVSHWFWYCWYKIWPPV